MKNSMIVSSRFSVEPVRAVSDAVWVEHGVGDRRCGEHGGGDAGNGDRRLDTLPGVTELGGGDQAHGGVDQPGRGLSPSHHAKTP
jgi:hypothetical protein